MLIPWLLAPGWTMRLYLLLLLLTSPVALLLYRVDAGRRRKHQPLIAPWKHHMLAFIGGWPGAWLGRKLFDERRPLGFLILFWLIIVSHLAFLNLVLISFILP